MGQRDSEGVWDGHVHTAIFEMNNKQGPPIWHMELCSMLCGSLDGRGVWGRMDICTRMAEFLHCSPETATTLLTSYTPIQNKKLKKNKIIQEMRLIFDKTVKHTYTFFLTHFTD